MMKFQVVILTTSAMSLFGIRDGFSTIRDSGSLLKQIAISTFAAMFWMLQAVAVSEIYRLALIP